MGDRLDGTAVPSWSCSKAVYKPVWQIQLLSVQWINSWWWTEELSEICRISYQNKFVKFVHLVGFIIKKFVTMHGHTNIKRKECNSLYLCVAMFTDNTFDHTTSKAIRIFISYRLHKSLLGFGAPSWHLYIQHVMPHTIICGILDVVATWM
jgi:hypothetical protein